MRITFRDAQIVPLLGIFLCASTHAALAQETQPRSSTAVGERLNVFPAGAHIAALDLRKVTTASSVAKSALARVDAATQSKASELAGRAKVLEAQRQKLEKEIPLLNDSARTVAQQAFAKAQLEFDRLREDAEAAVNEIRLEIERDLRARLFPVVDAVAREKGVHLVLNVSSADFVWIHPELDISDEVAQRLDIASKAPK